MQYRFDDVKCDEVKCDEVIGESTARDSFDAGNVVAARLSPMTLGALEPVMQRLLAGQQLFVKQADGTWRPKGLELGLARCFEFADLQAPALRMAGR